MNPYMFDTVAAIDKAKEHLEEQQLAYQTTLVAAAELTADPNADARELRAVQAQLRIIERDLAAVSSEVRSLTQLTLDEAEEVLAERVVDKGSAEPRPSTSTAGEEPAPTNDPPAKPTLQERLDAQLAELKRRQQDGGDRRQGSGRGR
ncbi:hypothetical protein IT072_03285 [Leifsonia sp. ZF2019]|uniref:hypothetical protein n=1 Tax=Leifsonia sp. ZF2019 TaxID=2781978 RepID=UPI001CBCB07F|nr:hypothetical protein [Leifsonia sp. ZF2019]UAJ80094.1 hypothetical protein IT072_03285 [Leifsonia sp. ZF2019]